MTFCGNYGDPLFAQDIFEITNYSLSNVLTHKGRLQINTNGGYKSKEWWAEYGSMLKSKPHLIVFAIDGLADTHHLYRVNTRFDRVIENAKSFIDAGGQAGWSFIRFGHNQHQEEEIRKLAKDLGFVKFIASNTQRFRGRSKIDYKWQGQDYSIERFKPSISKNYTAIETNSKLHKNQERYSKNQERVRMENIRQIKCFTEAKNEIYIDAKGYVYPCCWIG